MTRKGIDQKKKKIILKNQKIFASTEVSILDTI